MRKVILRAVFIILIVLIAESPGWAGPLDVNIRVGYVFWLGTGDFFDSLEETTHNDPFFEDASASKFNGFETEVEVIWKITPSLQISGTAGIFRKSLALSFNSPSFSLTDTFTLTIFPVLASIKYRWYRGTIARTSTLIPYLGGGGGIYPFSLELEDQTVRINEILFLTPRIVTDRISSGEVGFGAHVLGGVEIIINPRLSFTVENRFTFFGETELKEFNHQSINLSGNQVSGGILFKF